jgi:hypothetical protein
MVAGLLPFGSARNSFNILGFGLLNAGAAET